MIGPMFAAFAVTLFSLNDVIMKSLSADYALHQLVLVRAGVGILVVIGIIAPLNGGLHLLRTKRLGLHLARAGCIFFANMMFFLGLSVLPLADAVALFFVSPCLITIFSVIFLRETVGPRRWGAVVVGLVGVLIISRPGTSAFQVASLFPVAAAFGYAGLHILTRYMRNSENAVSMTFYIQAMFLVLSIVLGLVVGDGQYAGNDNGPLEFMLRSWVWPEALDWPLMMVIGVLASIGGFFISQAYRQGEAALVAPFEYLALPLSIVWGIMFFAEWPDLIVWLGIALIMGSGLYTVWRESQVQRDAMWARRLRT